MLPRIIVTFFSLFLVFVGKPVLANESASAEKEIAQLAGADYWRLVKNGEEGYTTSQSPEHGVLINASGQLWREVRNKWVTPIGGYVILGAFASLLAFYLWAGQIKLSKERTGNKVLRWTPFERALHWYTASLFLILALSGLLLMYGKYIMKPVVPYGVWDFVIAASKVSHNYLGPLFVIGLVAMLIKWMKNNFFNKVDLEWFKQGGGILPNGKHPQADFCNGGEKIWFWLLATAGVTVCVTGLVMDFPIFNQTRELMMVVNILHGISSLGLIAASLGHIYIGTVGTEGALEGMKTGYVDETWAKQHHNIWFERVKKQEGESQQ
ncbi:formate dehydrogenase subunit gamma [Vibrio nigripulchritudo]|uniref:formate dehydrogenase subunit gamma n=1 Tax=Vibrio nigripulchritudo TaxID=28173 RepID=UPI0024938AD7|nr:formate dehydrogenase subunit gamma [Vibrio nigripulchritudo]BDU37220.1 formate dehydrogenase subunit gamma [Vibrio nigripulchritudo]BDU42940.1 formate dehydrogenase subunit gamma [Vibrio nigripulchritudo]